MADGLYSVAVPQTEDDPTLNASFEPSNLLGAGCQGALCQFFQNEGSNKWQT
jgi:hypothetical protein